MFIFWLVTVYPNNSNCACLWVTVFHHVLMVLYLNVFDRSRLLSYLYTCIVTLECSSPMRLYALVTVALFVLFKCIVSSMHICLYICMGVETLAVLFKCIESSMHRRLCICMGVWDTCRFIQASRVVSGPSACFIQAFKLVSEPLACCFDQALKVVLTLVVLFKQ